MNILERHNDKEKVPREGEVEAEKIYIYIKRIKRREKGGKREDFVSRQQRDFRLRRCLWKFFSRKYVSGLEFEYQLKLSYAVYHCFGKDTRQC